jgi:hypothetical protein
MPEPRIPRSTFPSSLRLEKPRSQPLREPDGKSTTRASMRWEYEYGLWRGSTTSRRYVAEVAVTNLGLKGRGTSTYTAIAQPDGSAWGLSKWFVEAYGSEIIILA